jgi:hypothetical protein
MNYSLSNMLGRSGVRSKPIISGFAYPLETLTASRAGQWTIDGVPVIGETGSTFVVPLDAIGRIIACGDSNPLTVWHPNTIAAVARFWSSRASVFNSVSPNVLATDGQTVRRWDGIILGTEANQSTSVNQPIYRATGQSGGPSIEFDGSNDRLDLPVNSSVLQNVSQAYLIAGVRDTSPNSGAQLHTVIRYSTNASLTNRLGLYSRGGGGNNFNVTARRNDSDLATVVNSANNSNYNVLTAHGDYSNGFLRLLIDGVQTAVASLAGGSGNTSNTSSDIAKIGGDPNGAGFDALPGHLTAACVINAPISATDLSRIHRYIGLMGGKNIPLV